ncbi:MAG: heme-binding protein [Mycobacteriaceae bacterium]|nr:heme-binding protein [Mycobacteriaceae bacterium]
MPEHAEAIGATVTVAIVDGSEHLQVLERMDGASPLSARVAPAKGVQRRRMQQAWPVVFAQIDHVAGMPVVAGADSRLIRHGGVSGSAASPKCGNR